MRPSKSSNDIIGGVLAKSLTLFGVELFAFVFVSNHFHLLVRSTRLEIPAFMQYLRCNIAKKLGRHINWRGKFWDRRYDAEPVLDDEALVGRARYILAHGVKERLVERCKQWPGLTCLPELLEGERRAFAWPGGSNDERDDRTMPRYPLSVTALPCWRDVGVTVRQGRVCELVKDIELDARRETRKVLGSTVVLAQHPHDKPKHISRRRRPLCHASSRELYERYRAEYRAFVESYTEASSRYRSRPRDNLFPLYSYHPPGTQPELLRAA